MQQPAPGSELLRALAAAALREGDPAALAARAESALATVFQRQKSLVLEVQFTGFLFKGKPVGRVDPTLLRAAGQLIVAHVHRIGFTPDATAADLRDLFEGLAKPAAQLGPGGVMGWVQRRKPRGIYLSTTGGEVYRPAPAEKDAAAASPVAAPPQTQQATTVDQPAAAPEEAVQVAASAPSTSAVAAGQGGGGGTVFAAGGFMLFDEADAVELSDFELLLEDLPALGPPSLGPRPQAKLGPGGEAGANEMFHFFRAVSAEDADEEVERIPAMLAETDNPTRFDELAQAAVKAALRMLRSGQSATALELLDALVREAERPGRTRIFRDAAVQALRRAGAGETLQQLGELLQQGGADRARILRFLGFVGGDAVALLETMLFRAGDPELRAAIFRQLLPLEGMAGRIAARAMGDPSPTRTRVILELAALPDVDGDVALRWLADAAAHPDPAVRIDVARHAGALGGRGGLRILLDLLNNDRDLLVKKAAITALGTLGDTAAVPFLTRMVGAGDEEVQLAAIGALGRIGSGEALPALLGLVQKRAIFGSRKLSRPRAAAIAAIARLPTVAAREAIQSLAAGRDSELAAEARRVLDTMD
jgi:HEAT repeat protein